MCLPVEAAADPSRARRPALAKASRRPSSAKSHSWEVRATGQPERPEAADRREGSRGVEGEKLLSDVAKTLGGEKSPGGEGRGEKGPGRRGRRQNLYRIEGT